MKLTGENQSTRGKICPSATWSTTNSTWTGLVSDLGLRGERPATNRLSHGTASLNDLLVLYLHSLLFVCMLIALISSHFYTKIASSIFVFPDKSSVQSNYMTINILYVTMSFPSAVTVTVTWSALAICSTDASWEL
jgi:hypothetical protein